MKKVAVLMTTTRNNDLWLKKAITSVLNQNSADLVVHIYLYFDGCVIAPSVANFNGHIHTACSDKQRGMAYGLNRCIANVLKSGIWYDYIARMDDDDLIMPDKFKKQAAFLDCNECYDFCGTRMMFINKDDDTIGYADFGEPLVTENNGRTFFDKNTGVISIVHASVMFKSWILYELLLTYNPLIKKGSDYELWLRLLSYGIRYGLYNEHLYKYRCHNKQLSAAHNNTKAFYNMREGLFNFYKNNQEIFLHY